jgi:peptide/nickel transport system substrate-binding protein
MRVGKSLAVLAAIILSFAVSPSNAAEPTPGGTLIMLTQPEPPTLASYMSTSAPIGQIASKVYDGLLEYDFNMKPIPALAESFDISEDGKSITFKLRHGVKFHDGEPFTSADVKFSIQTLKARHPLGSTVFRDVESVETPDDFTAVLKLSRPAPYIIGALSGYMSPMLPKHLLEGKDLATNEYANKPVGTGPFKFVEWRRGAVIRLDRNPDYWRKGLPYLDRIVVQFIADASTRTAILEKGEAHVAGFGAISNNDVKRFENDGRHVVTTKGYEMLSPVVDLHFNTKKPPFDNVKVRQAISYAIDRQAIIDSVWFGYGKPATGPISSNFAVNGIYAGDTKSYNVPDRMAIANRLLDEAGLPRKQDGIRFEMVHDILPYGEEWQRLGEFIQQALLQVGIKVSLRREDVPTMLRRVYTDYDFDLVSLFFYNHADPVIGVHRLFESSAIKKGAVFVNGTRWSSPEVDEDLEKAAVEANPAARSALYQDAQKRIVEAAPMVWLSELQYPTVYDKRLHDLITSPLGIYAPFSQAWFEK